MRDSLFIAALAASAILAATVSACAAQAAMRWSLYGTLEVMIYGYR